MVGRFNFFNEEVIMNVKIFHTAALVGFFSMLSGGQPGGLLRGESVVQSAGNDPSKRGTRLSG